MNGPTISSQLLAIGATLLVPAAGVTGAALLRRRNLRASDVLDGVTVAPIGVIAWLLIMLALGAGLRAAMTVILLFGLAAPLVLLRVRDLSCWGVLRLAVLVLPGVVAAWLSMQTVPLLGDPAMIWGSKAAALKVTDQLSLVPLGGGQSLALRNPSHPLGVPALMCVAQAWLPGFEPRLCRLPMALFVAVLALLVDRELSPVCGAWMRVLPVVALTVVPPVFAQAFDGHADLALATTLFGSLAALGRERSIALAGLLAGGATLIKLEGYAVPVLGGLLLLGERRPRDLLAFLLGAASPVLVRIACQPVLAPDVASGSGLVPWSDVAIGPRLMHVARAFGARLLDVPTPWLPLVLLGAAGIVAAGVPGAARTNARRLLTAAILWLLAIAAAYLRHPSFEWQVEVHHRRAWLQVLPAVWTAGCIGIFSLLAARARPAGSVTDERLSGSASSGACRGSGASPGSGSSSA